MTYSYEGSSGKLTGSSAGSGGNAVSTALSYSKGFVSKITKTSGTVTGGSSTAAANTLKYVFGLDDFGNKTSVSVKGTDETSQIRLATYSYESGVNNGRMTGMTYANGDSMGYTYDSLGRTNGIAYSDGSSSAVTISYDYDINGVRRSKTVNGITYHYLTQNGQVVRQSWTKNGTDYVLDIIYDNNCMPYALNYSTDGGNRFTPYYYILNVQGDVIRLVNQYGTIAATYQYDAWGRVISVKNNAGNTPSQDHISLVNPIRYRGYYYDSESGLYYLKSRYYDPEVGRFISADGEISGIGGDITGYNLYSYCGNNPVKRIDLDGDAWKDIKNRFSNTWNKTKKIVTIVKKKSYSVYYKATKWHFEDRARENGTHPSY